MLNAHSRIAVPDKLVYFREEMAGASTHEWASPGLSQTAYRAYVRDFLQRNREVLAPLSIEDLEADICNTGPRDLRHPYALTLDRWAEAHGKVRWGGENTEQLVSCGRHPGHVSCGSVRVYETRPQSRRPLLRQVARTGPSLISFDDAFPQSVKWETVPSSHVAIPELSTFFLSAPSRYLEAPTYRIPEDFVSALPGALFSATNSVVLSKDRMIVDESSTAAGMQYFLKRRLYQCSSDLWGTAAPLRSRFHNLYH